MKRKILIAILFAVAVALWLAACEQPAPLVAPKREVKPEPTVAPTPATATAVVAPAPSATIPPDADADDEMAIVAQPEPPKDVIVALPPKPVLSKAGHNLILEFETGGQSGYDPHPEWPKGASGVTIGIGYDIGYTTRQVFEADWSALSDITVTRLSKTVGLTGERAHAKLSSVRDIMIEWGLATDVFDNVDVSRWWATTKKVLPGFDKLRPNAQAALVSLGFNRGWSMSGGNRIECRIIRDKCVPNRDYACIAEQLRDMKRIWRGTSIERGMVRRRDAEAELVLTP